jgi:hypothetical protein
MPLPAPVTTATLFAMMCSSLEVDVEAGSLPYACRASFNFTARNAARRAGVRQARRCSGNPV